VITYLYWTLVIVLACGALALAASVLRKPLAGVVVAAVVLLSGWLAYSFHFQQIFVKRWGGVMHITVPEGHRHIGATWKDENLWVENYDPATNTCEFREYSKGNLLEGRVIIKDCNPLMPAAR
jgi:hypothetical protein